MVVTSLGYYMSFGFVIDNRRCIGCHACTVACKAEHEIPIGNFRTWVKYVEKGEFPDVRRYFTVLRCNHCGDAPCVNICPTVALFHRSDGIVDFDGRQCIACKACMAACPYDALYIDPDSETAAKCNYCAHKIELGLQPACVAVCPVNAIVSGDLEASDSRIAQLVSLEPTAVRRPEKGTQPKVHYIDGDMASLTPGGAPKAEGYIWAERQDEDDPFADWIIDPAGKAARTAYDISHRRPWGKLVSLYLWTKSLSTGPILVAALLSLLGFVRAPDLFGAFASLFAFILGFATTLLLVGDLEHPERFLKILYRPNVRSWLVWGAFILILYSGVVFLWAVAGFLGQLAVIQLLLWPGLLLSVLAAGYSGFLLAQARGRDLWQSRLLFPHLVVQAFLAGSAVLVIASLYRGSGRSLTDLLLRCLLGGLVIHGLLVLSEIAMPHGTRDATGAVQYMVQGPLARFFWIGAVFAGIAFPIYQLAYYLDGAPAGPVVPASASVLSLLGLLAYDDCYIRAGQALPLS